MTDGRNGKFGGNFGSSNGEFRTNTGSEGLGFSDGKMGTGIGFDRSVTLTDDREKTMISPSR